MNLKEYFLKNKILLVIILVSVAMAIFFGFKKEGYHVDEMYSYGLANSEYLPFMHFGESGYDVKDWMIDYGAGESIEQLVKNIIKDIKILVKADFQIKNTEIYEKYLEAQKNSADTLTTSWVKGEEYKDYLTANKSNKFNYASVYYNQRGDVHPPLYYIILHTVCSLMEGHYSKWAGIGINIACMVLALICIYEMSDKFLGGKESAMVVAALYGISSASLSVTVYIRMYALLTLITMACIYLHLNIVDKQYKLRKKDYFQLGGIVLLGYLTQYYFVIYILGLASLSVIIMIINKKYKTALKYILTMLVSGVVGIIVWPFSIKHVFHGYRGNQAFASLKSSYSFEKLDWIFRVSVVESLGNIGFIILILSIVITIITIILMKKKYPFAKMVMLLLPSIFTIVIVSQISPLYTDRYLSNINPFFIIIPMYSVALFVRTIQDKIKKKDKKSGINIGMVSSISATALIIAVFNNGFVNPVNNLYTGGQETVEIADNTDCICVLPDGDWNEPAEDSMILAQCNKVGIVYVSNISVLKKGYKYKKGSEVLVNVAHSLDEDETLEKVKEELGLEDLKEIKRSESAWCTRIWLAQ